MKVPLDQMEHKASKDRVGPAGDDGSMMHAGEGAPDDDMGATGDYYLDMNSSNLYGPKTDNGWGTSIALKGANGEDGQDGEDGTQIHTGSGAPQASLGVSGDFYINLANQDLYGPKAGVGWGDPVNLNGEDGADGTDGADGENGADGSQIYSGGGVPDASLGREGDYYFDQTNKELYGPKTDTGWGTPINLQGTTNVIYSDWTAIDSWSTDLPTFKYGRFPGAPILILSPEMINSGGIFVYYKHVTKFSGTLIYLLPHEDKYEGGFRNGQTQIRYENAVQGNGIILRIESFERNLKPEEYSGPESEFRYVLIPGNTPGPAKARLSKRHYPIDLTDYEQVKKYFGIRDGNGVHMSKK